jgi:hypothetical protein
LNRGTALGDDPARVGSVRVLGIDETSFLPATCDHHSVDARRMVDLDKPKVIDIVEGNRTADLQRWLATQNPLWQQSIVENADARHGRRKSDPLYEIGKLLLTGAERLDERGNEHAVGPAPPGSPR